MYRKARKVIFGGIVPSVGMGLVRVHESLITIIITIITIGQC